MLVAHEAFMSTELVKELMEQYNQKVVNAISCREFDVSTNTNVNVLSIASYKQQFSPVTSIETNSTIRIDNKDVLVENRECVHVPVIVCAIINGEELWAKGENCVDNLIQHISSFNQNLMIYIHSPNEHDYHTLCDNTLDEPIRLLDLNGSLVAVDVHLISGKVLTFKNMYTVTDVLLTSTLPCINSLIPVVVNDSYDDWLNDNRYLEYCMSSCRKLKHSLE
jgi:hypothetical protein